LTQSIPSLVPKKEIRILQLIDSLEAGGAERMAVTYANALHQELGFGALACTRAEGMLKQQLLSGVVYTFLARKNVFDFAALLRLYRLINQHHITHIHAHSSSVFFAVLLKLLCPSVRLLWHDHYGKSEMLEQRPFWTLRIASLFVTQIIAVNQQLVHWSKEKLWCKKVTYLPNFTLPDTSVAVTQLHGTMGKRIVCLANLRPQKNHMLLLDIAKVISQSHPEYTFHLVGKDFNDAYAATIKATIVSYGLQDTVFLYGSCDDIPAILNQSTVGILTSDSEGLPIALLEYGFYNLPVVVTAVGEIPEVVTHDKEGFVVPKNDSLAFINALQELLDNPNLQATFARQLNEKVVAQYSSEAVLKNYLKLLDEK
jgi:glycosyltransferase involved in cell wall biosynthesis